MNTIELTEEQEQDLKHLYAKWGLAKSVLEMMKAKKECSNYINSLLIDRFNKGKEEELQRIINIIQEFDLPYIGEEGFKMFVNTKKGIIQDLTPNQ